MSPHDLLTHTRLCQSNTALNKESSILISVAFTPGSCDFKAYKITSAGTNFPNFNLLGYTWGKENKEISNEAI